MARRTRDWNEGLAQDVRDPEFARDFLLAAMDEGVPIQTALGNVIRVMGVREFAEQARMASPNVLRAIHPRHNPGGAPAAVLLGVEGQDWETTILETSPEFWEFIRTRREEPILSADELACQTKATAMRLTAPDGTG